MRKSAAFTLIEVLIALVIIAIALAAAVRSVNESVRTTIHVREVVAAHWVGLNILSEIKTHMIPAPTDTNPVQGKTEMMNLSLSWRARAETSPLWPGIDQITVTVSIKNHSLQSVIGYVAKTAGSP